MPLSCFLVDYPRAATSLFTWCAIDYHFTFKFTETEVCRSSALTFPTLKLIALLWSVAAIAWPPASGNSWDLRPLRMQFYYSARCISGLEQHRMRYWQHLACCLPPQYNCKDPRISPFFERPCIFRPMYGASGCHCYPRDKTKKWEKIVRICLVSHRGTMSWQFSKPHWVISSDRRHSW